MHGLSALLPCPFYLRDHDSRKMTCNRPIRLDLCWIEDEGENHSVLDIIDTATHMQAASFLSGEDLRSVWGVFVMAWFRLFVGDPDVF